MRFEITQQFPRPAAVVQAAYLDPAFLESMARLPRLGAPELLEQVEEGGRVRRRIRFRFSGELSSAVRAVVDPSRLTWVEESLTDLEQRHTTWIIRPDHYAEKLSSSGQYRILEDGPESCRRVATGEVKVRVFLVGSKVEGAIVSGMREHALVETEALLARLGG